MIPAICNSTYSIFIKVKYNELYQKVHVGLIFNKHLSIINRGGVKE